MTEPNEGEHSRVEDAMYEVLADRLESMIDELVAEEREARDGQS